MDYYTSWLFTSLLGVNDRVAYTRMSSAGKIYFKLKAFMIDIFINQK